MVDAKRAGYVGLNPLSTNIEYYLQPWARGGTGGPAVEMYLRQVLPFAKKKYAFMMKGNERSVRTFRASLENLGFADGREYTYFTYRKGSGFRLQAGAKPPESPGPYD